MCLPVYAYTILNISFLTHYNDSLNMLKQPVQLGFRFQQNIHIF